TGPSAAPSRPVAASCGSCGAGAPPHPGPTPSRPALPAPTSGASPPRTTSERIDPAEPANGTNPAPAHRPRGEPGRRDPRGRAPPMRGFAARGVAVRPAGAALPAMELLFRREPSRPVLIQTPRPRRGGDRPRGPVAAGARSPGSDPPWADRVGWRWTVVEGTHVQLEWPQPDVALVRLNRPERMNAFDTAMAQGLAACFEDLHRRTDLRAVVLCGAGERAFCTGADLKERATLDEQAWFAQHHVFQRMFRAVAEA